VTVPKVTPEEMKLFLNEEVIVSTIYMFRITDITIDKDGIYRLVLRPLTKSVGWDPNDPRSRLEIKLHSFNIILTRFINKEVDIMYRLLTGLNPDEYEPWEA
jgi:hypothetical protein